MGELNVASIKITQFAKVVLFLVLILLFYCLQLPLHLTLPSIIFNCKHRPSGSILSALNLTIFFHLLLLLLCPFFLWNPYVFELKPVKILFSLRLIELKGETHKLRVKLDAVLTNEKIVVVGLTQQSCTDQFRQLKCVLSTRVRVRCYRYSIVIFESENFNSVPTSFQLNYFREKHYQMMNVSIFLLNHICA